MDKEQLEQVARGIYCDSTSPLDDGAGLATRLVQRMTHNYGTEPGPVRYDVVMDSDEPMTVTAHGYDEVTPFLSSLVRQLQVERPGRRVNLVFAGAHDE